MEEEEKKKMRSVIHLIKANHGIAKRRKPWTTLPQFLPISFTETFVQLLDEKMKMKRELSTMVCDVCKPTR